MFLRHPPDGASAFATLALAAGILGCHGAATHAGAGAGGSTSSTGTTTTGTTGTTSTSTTTAMGDPCRGAPLPVGQHYVPAGMCARMVASNLGTLRQITFASNGDLIGVLAGGAIKLFHDADGNGVFDPAEIVSFGSTGGNGNNCHVDEKGGHLYCGSPDGVIRFAYMPGDKTLGASEPVVTGQPGDGNHPKHTVHVYDGYLYVHSGSSGNASNPMSPAYDTDRALLRRFNLADYAPGTPFAWSSGEVFSQGLRNMLGYTKNAAGRMYGIVNGLDDIHYQGTDVHQDNPGEQVVALGMGKTFGYPFCFTAQRVVQNGAVIPPGTQLFNQDFPSGLDDAWCAQHSTPPATFIQAHSAPLDITFFDAQPAGALPEKWRGGAFIALHGSWDRGAATGYKVIWMPFDAAGNAPMPTSDATTTTFPYEVVLGGGAAGTAKDGPWTWTDGTSGENPRPGGLAISPIDGALYISSDSSGFVYRVGLAK